jgi:hypothetical protein
MPERRVPSRGVGFWLFYCSAEFIPPLGGLIWSNCSGFPLLMILVYSKHSSVYFDL